MIAHFVNPDVERFSWVSECHFVCLSSSSNLEFFTRRSQIFRQRSLCLRKPAILPMVISPGSIRSDCCKNSSGWAPKESPWICQQGDLWQQWWRRQRECQNAIGLIGKRTTFCMCSTLFCTFLCCHCMAMAWESPISCFMEDINKQQGIFLFLSKLECGPQEIKSREIRLHLTFSANWNKRDKVCKILIHLKVTFLLLLPSSMLKPPTVGEGRALNESLRGQRSWHSKVSHAHHC